MRERRIVGAYGGVSAAVRVRRARVGGAAAVRAADATARRRRRRHGGANPAGPAIGILVTERRHAAIGEDPIALKLNRALASKPARTVRVGGTPVSGAVPVEARRLMRPRVVAVRIRRARNRDAPDDARAGRRARDNGRNDDRPPARSRLRRRNAAVLRRLARSAGFGGRRSGPVLGRGCDAAAVNEATAREKEARGAKEG